MRFDLFIIIIILSFCNCASQVYIKPVSQGEVLNKIPHWQENFSIKSGTGEIIISDPGFRYSSYFSFDYEVATGILSGKLLGSFGMIVGRFYLSPDSISISDREGKELQDKLSFLIEGLSMENISRLISWDVPLASNLNVIPIDGEWVLVSRDYEVFISPGFLPYRALMGKNSRLSIEYDRYRTVNGFKQPFIVTVKKGKSMLRLQYTTIKLK
ncbi:hypothetical protein KAW18_10115 [candidate division WOR-3 bacterium]|nr:hypothetical protein [candidate division WOR-3 bacterium]MCK4527715.1 hypothetical protein [candidate division WOR-3 bacterium]